MAEVIAAIVGVLLGALVTWLLNRSRPHYMVCEDSFKARIAIGGKPWSWSVSWHRQVGQQDFVSFAMGLPQTKIFFKDQTVDVLTVLRLKFRNSGDKVINHPKVVIKLGESARILGCDIHFEPERSEVEATQKKKKIQSEPSTSECDSSFTIVEPDNKIAVALGALYPHNATQEVAILDIYCSGEIKNPEVSGRGTFQDGSVWATKFEPWEESQNRARRRVNRFNLANITGLLVVFIGYMIWRPPTGLVIIDSSAITAWVSHPLFFVLVGWVVLLLGYAFYMGMRGWLLRLPIPFLKRALEISIQRIRDK